MSWFWTLFIVYYIVMIILYEKFLIKLKPIIKGDPALHQKYDAFRRTDSDWFSNRLLMYPILWTFLPKFLLVATGMVLAAVACIFFSIGLTESKHPKKFTGIRYYLVRTSFYLFARMAVFGISNVYWVSHSRPKVCYKKYLGPEWKADYGLAGSMVANHTAF